MKWVMVALLLGFNLAAQAQSRDPRFYEIHKIHVTEIKDNAQEQRQLMNLTYQNLQQGCQAKFKNKRPHTAIDETPGNLPGGQTGTPPGQQPGGPFDGGQQGPGGLDYGGGFPHYPGYGSGDIILDRIINIGKVIWAVVDAGRPVVNFKTDVAHGLPSGISCWTELEGWKPPMIKAFRIGYENAFGVTVVNYEFRVSFIYGGSFNGRGHYITHAMFQPKKIDVAWGFRFDAVATIPAVVNQGTRSAPVAAIQMNMNWKVSSAVKHMQQGEIFYINGLGQVQHVK